LKKKKDIYKYINILIYKYINIIYKKFIYMKENE